MKIYQIIKDMNEKPLTFYPPKNNTEQRLLILDQSEDADLERRRFLHDSRSAAKRLLKFVNASLREGRKGTNVNTHKIQMRHVRTASRSPSAPPPPHFFFLCVPLP